ncbi:unnamed protein product [Pipistrellus nathusii]|uniref:Uncharacterized protein n=1 Tax=Pipistrellus nathusii TaxID=59473 RepID=A0ABP0A5V9_PIPNA
MPLNELLMVHFSRIGNHFLTYAFLFHNNNTGGKNTKPISEQQHHLGASHLMASSSSYTPQRACRLELDLQRLNDLPKAIQVMTEPKVKPSSTVYQFSTLSICCAEVIHFSLAVKQV